MITFGTAGFRGIIGDNFTKENIQRIGVAFRKVIDEVEGKNVKVIVGYDNRFMGKDFAKWFCDAATYQSKYIQCTLVAEPIATPYVSYEAANGYDYGIMITASHNPHFYNGIKVMLRGGKDADDAFCDKIMMYLKTKENTADIKSGTITMLSDTSDYVDKVCSSLDTNKIKSSGLRVLVDPMYGSGTSLIKQIFDKCGVNYTMIRDTVDPYFGGGLPAPYPHNLIDTARQVVQGKYSFGVAFDGDADRITFIDTDGTIYECNFVAAIYYYYFTKIKGMKGGFVKNFLTSNLTSKLCRKMGFEAHETRVGYKYICPKMESTDAILGAEGTSVAFTHMSLSKDGVSAAAFLVDMLANVKMGIGQLIKQIAKEVGFESACMEFAYTLTTDRREPLLKKFLSNDLPDFKMEIVGREFFPDGHKVIFKGDYWCAARLSGTENIARMYFEMPTDAQCRETIALMEKFYGLTERQK